ncbi:MAG TPA: hypothetical protein V6D08_17800 [Candidatus Obscuribacterales bacterium]
MLPIPVYENVILVEADSVDKAMETATLIAEAEVKLDDTITVDNKPAQRLFAGIRKVVTIQNPEGITAEQSGPTMGTEVTYSLFEVASEEDLEKLANGDAVTVTYVE